MYKIESRPDEQPPDPRDNLEAQLKAWKDLRQIKDNGSNIGSVIEEKVGSFRQLLRDVTGARLISRLQQNHQSRLERVSRELKTSIQSARLKIEQLRSTRLMKLRKFWSGLRDMKYMADRLHQTSSADGYDIAVFYNCYDTESLSETNQEQTQQYKQRNQDTQELIGNMLGWVAALKGSTSHMDIHLVRGDLTELSTLHSMHTLPKAEVLWEHEPNSQLDASHFAATGSQKTEFYCLSAQPSFIQQWASHQQHREKHGQLNVAALDSRDRSQTNVLQSQTYNTPFDNGVFLDRNRATTQPAMLQGDFSCARRLVTHQVNHTDEVRIDLQTGHVESKDPALYQYPPLSMRSNERQEWLKWIYEHSMSTPPDEFGALFSRKNPFATNRISFLDSLAVDMASRMHNVVSRTELSLKLTLFDTALNKGLEEAESHLAKLEAEIAGIGERMDNITKNVTPPDEEDEEHEESNLLSYQEVQQLQEEFETTVREVEWEYKHNMNDSLLLKKLVEMLNTNQQAVHTKLTERGLHTTEAKTDFYESFLVGGIENALLTPEDMYRESIIRSYQQGIQALDPGYLELLRSKYSHLPLMTVDSFKRLLWGGTCATYKTGGNWMSKLSRLLAAMEQLADENMTMESYYSHFGVDAIESRVSTDKEKKSEETKAAGDGAAAEDEVRLEMPNLLNADLEDLQKQCTELFDLIMYSEGLRPAHPDLFKGWTPWMRVCDVVRSHNLLQNNDIKISAMADKCGIQFKQNVNVSQYEISLRLLKSASAFAEKQMEIYNIEERDTNAGGLFELTSVAVRAIGIKITEYRQLREHGASHNSKGIAVIMHESSRFYCMQQKANGQPCHPVGVDHCSKCTSSKSNEMNQPGPGCAARCRASQCPSCQSLTSQAESHTLNPCSARFISALKGVIDLLYYVAAEHGSQMDQSKMVDMKRLFRQVGIPMMAATTATVANIYYPLLLTPAATTAAATLILISTDHK